MLKIDNISPKKYLKLNIQKKQTTDAFSVEACIKSVKIQLFVSSENISGAIQNDNVRSFLFFKSGNVLAHHSKSI